MSTRLLLTLGHNSSAIFVQDDHIVCGYEEERLTGLKSDSRFPINAIMRCLQVAQVSGVSEIYATHWDPMGDIDQLKKKYWDPSGLPKHKVLHTNDAMRTHHDCHAASAIWYANGEPSSHDLKEKFTHSPTLIIVCDGFGNFGEHLSIYRIDSSMSEPRLVKRVFGYDTSLGLMYQYMTAFLGMKMHEDEYKLLGYEAHIGDIDVDREALDSIIRGDAGRWIHNMFSSKRVVSTRDPVVMLDALPGVQSDFIEKWRKIAHKMDISDEDITGYRSRVIFAYYAQNLLEQVILAAYLGFKYHGAHNLLVAGGVFYNVKLNMLLASHTKGKFCAFPLAGDQGNAIGLSQLVKPNSLRWPGHFNWGVRPNTYLNASYLGFYEMDDPLHFREQVSIALDHRDKVNIVRGAMEFGPRALCNTSTIALPSKRIVDDINRANGRNTVMPMAPVMRRREFEHRFEWHHKIHMSEKHMIMALRYVPGKADDVQGAAHFYEDGSATGRPQVIDDDVLMCRLLDEVAGHVLINTSFNVHGHPIVYSKDHALSNHLKQLEVDPTTVTVYLKE